MICKNQIIIPAADSEIGGRFFMPMAGENGLTNAAIDILFDSLGVVLQDVNLFTDTVRENIRYGRLAATDEEVAAAKLAGADSFITRLPQRYDTRLSGNGANLSQGQRQLLSIARAAIADPPVLILDEATSSIDTRTERIVQEGMDKHTKVELASLKHLIARTSARFLSGHTTMPGKDF